MGTPKQIRKEHLQIRKEMPENGVCSKSERICEKLIKREEHTDQLYYYLYYPLGKEVSLLPFAKWLLEQKKRVAFPKVNGENMDFYEITDLHDFKEGSFHIMEPCTAEIVTWEKATVLVPGAAFDLRGNRIGYGKGYYDRYFSKHLAGEKIGIAFEHQIEAQIQAETWDQPMDEIITEEEHR